MPDPPDLFARVLALHDEGRCMDAWEAGKAMGDLVEWPLVESRILAARLAHHLGAPRLSHCLSVTAFRADRHHPLAQYYHVLRTFERRGALAAWRERTRLGVPPPGHATAHGDYHGQCALILGALRDFQAAESHITRSRAAADRPYWYVERAGLFEMEDRYEEALAVAREGLAAHPRYPPTILVTARALQLLDRDDEALDHLRSAAADAQSSTVIASLITVLLKRRLLEEAETALGRYDALTPLKEAVASDFLAITRADLAVYRGDYQTAMALVEQVKHPYYETVARSLRAFLTVARGTPARRVELSVPFVRQHHLTCAPATLSAISRFWNHRAAHLDVAEEICYDGTPFSSERRWANENGWRTVEFRVDWHSATALLDRGVPFTLTLRDVAHGHLVAAIGYEEARDLLLVRDPMQPGTGEIKARELFEQQRAGGPRGMAMVPLDRADLLDDLHLPEAELYDLSHELELALQRHDRVAASALLDRMVAAAPRHRLTWNARRSLAAYDDNPHEGLAAIDGLLALYPGDPGLLRSRLGSLGGLATRDDRLAWLAGICVQPGADPVLWIEYAAELASDARMLPRALHFIRRALRYRPDDAYGILQLARVTRGLGARAEALELSRFASCLNETREDAAQDYFNACRWLERTDVGLAFLRARVERLGARSALPALTLFSALETLDRIDEAFAVLDGAVALRPHDGALRIFAANRSAAWGRARDAAEHLAVAGNARRTLRLAEQARAARLAGDRARALHAWREILDTRPLDYEAHGAVAQLLSETTDADAAAQHLRAFCDRFPHNAGLHHLLYEWTAHRPADERERVLREFRAIDTANVWAARELARNLCGQARFDEALQAADDALALDDSDASSHYIRAWVLHGAARTADAALGYRAAIARSADVAGAIHGLLDIEGETRARSIAVLAFVESALMEQPVVGGGVLAFRAAARGILTPDELLVPLERLQARRPDLWQSWSALCAHNTDMGRTDAALDVARQATERFSHVPQLWLDLSLVHRVRHELDLEIAALQRCREIDPYWTAPIIELAAALDRAGRVDDSQHTLESAIHLMPLVPELRGQLALLQHRRGDVATAIATLREALRISPDYEWAWGALTSWSPVQTGTSTALELARAMAEARPGEFHAWVRLADVHINVRQPEPALAALEHALRINPLDVGAHDRVASALTLLRRFADAEAACHPPAFGQRTPFVLLGRAAWVAASRGDLSGAIARMREVVEAHPDYVWGWHQLVDWLARMEMWEEATRVAERLTWLEPHSVQPLQWIGDLKLHRGDRRGAAEAFQRAMRLDPADPYAGLQLVHLMLAEGDYDGARRTLGIQRQFAARDDILAAEAELAAAQADAPGYLARLRELCGNPDGGDAAATRAVGVPTPADWSPQLERVLKQVMQAPAWNPITATLWVRVRARRGRLGGPFAYRRLAHLGEPGKRAIAEVLGHIAEAVNKSRSNSSFTNARLRLQLELIRYFCRGWRDDVHYWGQYGYALTSYRRPYLAARWLSDWESRSDVQPWMVQNLASALLSLHRDRQARAVLRSIATNVAPHVDVDVVLGLWCAIGACIDHDLPLAERLLDGVPRDAEAAKHTSLRELATTVLAVCRDARLPASLTSDRTASLERTQSDLQRFRDSGHLARLAMLTVARHVRHPGRIIGAWWKLYWGYAIAAAIAGWYVWVVLSV